MSNLTKTEAKEIRVEQILPYLNNAAGATLESVLLSIDSFLKSASPEAMTPGLINWENKNLFVDKWIRDSGTGIFNYNKFGESKIGKGRYEISGIGRWYFDKLLAVSEVKGVTGRIFLGATQPGAMISVGVLCFNADKVYIGSNGGFVCDNFTIPYGNYLYKKSSSYGEMDGGTRFFKPGTRFVKLFIEVINNPSIVYFDESELTTFDLDERYLQIFSNVMDWNAAEMFYSELVADTAFTFDNDIDGRVRTITIKNAGVNDIRVTFPQSLWQGGLPLTLIRPGRRSVFTFMKCGGSILSSVIEELE